MLYCINLRLTKSKKKIYIYLRKFLPKYFNVKRNLMRKRFKCDHAQVDQSTRHETPGCRENVLKLGYSR